LIGLTRACMDAGSSEGSAEEKNDTSRMSHVDQCGRIFCARPTVVVGVGKEGFT
jgi:hypothetical protein